MTVVEQRFCENPNCGKPLDPERVKKKGARTCDDACRAAAWKARVGYGRKDRPVARKTRANGKPRKPEMRVSYHKAVDAACGALATYVMAQGCSEEDAREEIAEAIADALTPRQRAALEAEARG